MEATQILNQFGIEVENEPVSIYPYSPVYKVQFNQQQVIIKRTQRPFNRAQNLMQFITSLNKAGVNIVTPLSKPKEADEDIFIMYPFIEGTTYSATNEEIVVAGELLGKIHSLSSATNDYSLSEYDEYDFTIEEVAENMQKIRKHITNANRNISIDLMEKHLLEAVKEQSKLQKEPLQYVATPYDYKANNLVYTPVPYVIDPDNASWTPRIFDLALVLLFHNELDTAPESIFTPKQWDLFMSGYSEYNKITQLEADKWEAALKQIFLDEVIWLMAEYEEDWLQEKQYKLFESLIRLIEDSSIYKIK